MLPLPLNVGIMLTGYLLVMACLACGLLILHRDRTSREPAVTPPPPPRRRGWPALILHVTGTAVGGYLLLMTVITAYYYATAGLGGRFLLSAFTGCAALLALTLPLLLATSWAVNRRRRRQ